MKHEKLIFIINLIIAATLCAGGVLIPYASLILTLASVGFFAVFTYKNTIAKSMTAIAVALAATFASYFVFGINIDTICGAASDFCLMALSGSSIGLMMKYGCSYRTVLSGGAFIFLLPFLIEFAKLRFYYGVDLIQVMITEPFESVFAMYSELLASYGAEEMTAVTAQLENIKHIFIQAITVVVPAFLIITCTLCSFITFLVCRKFVFCRYGDVLIQYPHFWELQMPRSASWLIAILYTATMFMKASSMSGALNNIILILCAMYCICSISIIDFFFRKTRVHWALRALIYCFAVPIFFTISPTVPILAGVIDSTFDFRRLRRRRTEI